MSCDEIVRAIRRGELPVGPEVDAHLAACDACTELLVDDGRLGLGLAEAAHQPPADAAEVDRLRGDVAATFAAERGLVAALRGLSTPRRVALLVVAVVGLAAALFVGKPRVDLAVYPAERMFAALAAFGLVVGGAVSLVLRPAFRPASSGRQRAFWLLLALAVPLAIAAAPQAHTHHGLSVAGAGADLVARALGCFVFGLFAIALPVLLLLRALDRGEQRALTLAALSAAGAAVAANLALSLHCPVTGVAHLVLGHATIGVVLTAVYVALVAGVSARRRERAAG